MAPQYGWEFCLAGVGWESSRVVSLTTDQSLAANDLSAAYLPDQKLNPLNGTHGGDGTPAEKLALLCAGWRV